MLIPVFTVLAQKLEGATPALLGLALGSYGFAQGLLQIPFGLLSDKFGRKPLLSLGLALFALGSLIGALSHSIFMIIVARILQGMGAIGSVLLALLADLTPPQQRSMAMAIIGVSIGLSFGLAVILSPLLTAHYGLSAIFYLSLALSILGLFFVHFLIPERPTEQASPSLLSRNRLKQVLFNPKLQYLNLSIFLQHFILTATFYVLPLLLNQVTKNNEHFKLWHFYFSLMTLSFLGTLILLPLFEKKGKTALLFQLSVCFTIVAQIVTASSSGLGLWLSMGLYFLAFNTLEALLPSFISREAGLESKGTAMGAYSTSQFLGLFCGGLSTGLLYQFLGIKGTFLMNGLLALFWFLLHFKLRKPNKSCYNAQSISS